MPNDTDSVTGMIDEFSPDDEAFGAALHSAGERPPRRSGLAAQLLMAAMVGLREGLELGRHDPEQTVILADGFSTKDLPLDFGPLPPID